MKVKLCSSLLALGLIAATPLALSNSTWAAEKAGGAAASGTSGDAGTAGNSDTTASTGKADDTGTASKTEDTGKTGDTKATDKAASTNTKQATKQVGKQRAGQANFGNLISALNNISVQAQNISALDNNNIGKIEVVHVEDVLSGNNIQALNNALNRNNVQVLNDAINNNEVVKNALNANDINISDVVAVEVLSGNITVFTR